MSRDSQNLAASAARAEGGAGAPISPALNSTPPVDAVLAAWDWCFEPDTSYWSDEMYGLFDVDASSPPSYGTVLPRIHADDLSRIEQSIATAKQTGRYDEEFRLILRDGRVRWIAARGRVIRDSNGKAQRMVGVSYEITGRKIAEHALQESEDRFRKTFESATIGIAHVSPSGRFLLVNGKLCDILGYSREQLLGRSFEEITHPESQEHVAALERLLRGEIPILRIEKRYVRPNGETVWAAVTSTAHRNQDGTVAYFLATVEDISDKKRLETERRSSEERLAAALAAADMGTFRWDMRTNELWWDESLKRLFGMEGRSISKIEDFVNNVHPEDRGAVRGELERCIREEGDFYLEYRVVWADGSIHWIVDRGTTVKGTDGHPAYMVGACVDITGVKRAQLLAESEQKRLDAVLEAMPIGVFICDEEGRIIRRNAAGAAIWDEPEFRNRRPEEYFEYKAWWPHNGKRIESQEWALARAMAKGTPIFEEEIEIETFTGKRKTIVNYALPVRDSSGKITGGVAVNVDITERKQSELRLEAAYRQLRHERTRLQRVFAEAPAFMCTLRGPDHIFELANPTYGRLLGNRPLIGRPVREVLPELEGQNFFELLDQVYRTGEAFVARELEVHLAAAGGAEDRRFLNFVYQPMFDDNRNIFGIFVHGYDVTEEVSARNKIEELAETNRAIADNAASALFLMDARGCATFMNPAAVQMTGYDLEELRDRPLHDYVHFRHEDGREFPIDECPIVACFRNSNTLRNHEDRFLRKDGSMFPVSCSFTPMHSAGEVRGGVLEVRDITQQKKAEEALRKSEMLATAGRFAATIAHEINNPLAGAVNLLYLARTSDAVTPKLKTYLDEADNQLQRVAQIARQTLGFYRERSTPASLNLASVVDSVLPLYAPKLEARSVIVQRDYLEARNIVANAGEVRQVISNLLTNSIDALPTGGHLKLRVKRSPRAGYTRLMIADSGGGVHRENFKKIFEPFFTTKRDVGTGLGLWVTHEIVKNHGGHMRFASSTREGKSGTTFVIDWPQTIAKSEMAAD